MKDNKEAVKEFQSVDFSRNNRLQSNDVKDGFLVIEGDGLISWKLPENLLEPTTPSLLATCVTRKFLQSDIESR
jgi:hypothetical protein